MHTINHNDDGLNIVALRTAALKTAEPIATVVHSHQTTRELNRVDREWRFIDLTLHCTEPQYTTQINLIDDIEARCLPDINLNTNVDTSSKSFKRTVSKGNTIQVLYSFVLHTLGIATLIYFSAKHIPQAFPPNQAVTPIQATLYFPPKVQEAVPKSDLSEVAKTPVAPEIEAPSESHQAATEMTRQAESPATINSKPVASLKDEADIVNIDDSISTAPTLESQTSSGNQLQRLNQALNSHLNGINELHMQAMSESASTNRQQHFYQQQTQGYQLPKAEPEMKIKKIDCSGAAGKTAGLLSGLMGGTLRCNDTPDFQRYIDARLDKETPD